jgi:protein disulfide-isomerase A1
MTKQNLPSVSTLTSDTLEDFKTQDKIVLVAYFAADDKTSNETFSGVAESLRDTFLFGATSDAALAKAAGVEQPGLILFKDFDDGATKFDGKFAAEAIEQFAQTESMPLVGEVGPDTYARYMAVSRTGDRSTGPVPNVNELNLCIDQPTSRIYLRRNARGES